MWCCTFRTENTWILLFYNHSTRAQQELFTPNAHLKINAVLKKKNACVQCDTSVGGSGTSWSIVIVLEPPLLLSLDFPVMCC